MVSVKWLQYCHAVRGVGLAASGRVFESPGSVVVGVCSWHSIMTQLAWGAAVFIPLHQTQGLFQCPLSFTVGGQP